MTTIYPQTHIVPHHRPAVFVCRATDCLDGFWLSLDQGQTANDLRTAIDSKLGKDAEWDLSDYENIPSDVYDEIRGSVYKLEEVCDLWLHSSSDIEWEVFVAWANSTYKSKLWGNYHSSLSGTALSGKDFAFDLYHDGVEHSDLPDIVRLNIDWEGIWSDIQSEYEVIEASNGEKYFFAY